jgi:predicted Zn-dependent protease with MMP-like domain
MEKEKFEALVMTAIGELPPEFQRRLENLDVVVQDYPTSRQLAKNGLRYGRTLLGLYEGIPHTKRTSGYNMVLPDKITIFQKPIEAKCGFDEEIMKEMQRVVRHEIAHHFGIDDHRLREIERSKQKWPKRQTLY